MTKSTTRPPRTEAEWLALHDHRQWAGLNALWNALPDDEAHPAWEAFWRVVQASGYEAEEIIVAPPAIVAMAQRHESREASAVRGSR